MCALSCLVRESHVCLKPILEHKANRDMANNIFYGVATAVELRAGEELAV